MKSEPFKLYHYWRSSASWRVRMGIEYYEIPYSVHPINLLTDEAESREHLDRNPAGTVPTLEFHLKDEGDAQGRPYCLSESLAILFFLQDEKPSHPEPLIPLTSLARSKVLHLFEIINAGTHPLQNLPVLDLISETDQAARKKWASHWIHKGLKTYHDFLERYQSHSDFSVGSHSTIADLALIPQMYNARRFDVDLTAFPRLLHIETHHLGLPWVKRSHPDSFQP